MDSGKIPLPTVNFPKGAAKSLGGEPQRMVQQHDNNSETEDDNV